jgi:hypothetical protein
MREIGIGRVENRDALTRLASIATLSQTVLGAGFAALRRHDGNALALLLAFALGRADAVSDFYKVGR